MNKKKSAIALLVVVGVSQRCVFTSFTVASKRDSCGTNELIWSLLLLLLVLSFVLATISSCRRDCSGVSQAKWLNNLHNDNNKARVIQIGRPRVSKSEQKECDGQKEWYRQRWDRKDSDGILTPNNTDIVKAYQCSVSPVVVLPAAKISDNTLTTSSSSI